MTNSIIWESSHPLAFDTADKIGEISKKDKPAHKEKTGREKETIFFEVTVSMSISTQHYFQREALSNRSLIPGISLVKPYLQ